MALSVLLFFLSAILTGVTFYFGGFYQNIIWIWILPVLLFAFFWAGFALFALWGVALGLKYQRSGKRYAPSRFGMWVLSQTCFVVLLLCRCRVHASGLGKIDMKKRSYMIVSNHLSAFDHVGFVSIFHGLDVIAVSKKANEEMFGIGGWIKRAGYLAIDQNDMVGGAEIISRAGNLLQDNISSVMICPEGTRNKDFPEPVMLPFHPGSFHLATDAKAPIALFALQNTNAIVKRFPSATHIYIDCVGLIEPEEYQNLSMRELSEHCQGLIARRLEQKKARFYHLKRKKDQEEE